MTALLNSVPQNMELQSYRASGLSPDEVMALATAQRENRLVVLPSIEKEKQQGLYGKYRVYKACNGEPVENCFVLRPDKDEDAQYALLCYGAMTKNLQLKADIKAWVESIREAAEAALKDGEQA